jgi:methyl-accepting chemotaxis protein
MSSTKIDQGVGLVVEAGKALERIVNQVTEINTVVNEISASAQEESNSIAQVNTAVAELDGVTQGNAAMVEQSTASSHSLAQETENLASLLARFKVNGVDGQVIKPEDSASAAKADRAASERKRPVRSNTPAPRAHKVAVNAGPSASAEAPAGDWEEF